MRLLVKAAQIMTALACVITSVAISSPVAQAAVYYYRPTHPMNERVGSHVYCTGGFGIRTSSNNLPYFLTAGHCFSDGQSVWGTDGQFGITADSRADAGYDTAAVAPLGSTDGLQEIPGLGRVIGKMSDTYSSTAGNAIALQGRTSGRQYGTITGWIYHGNTWLACANIRGGPGDSGGPVFTHDAGGRVYAAGIIIGGDQGTNTTCFMTIDNLLTQWKAYLPVFSAKAAKTAQPDVALSADSAGPTGRPLEGVDLKPLHG